MVDIILSIKPEFAEKILNGEKLFEFRKQVPRQKISWVFIYASSPFKKIVGCFRVKNILNGTPEEIWEKCGSYGGIDQERFFSYCGENEIVYGFEISEVTKFEPPINPYEGDGNFKAPQSFAYYENKYGMD
ncbi:MAG: ASCH domain-containing protein [Thermoplasmata archaeon]|nr:ASCH domain-containing protein [Thermoplasmata archaeon]